MESPALAAAENVLGASPLEATRGLLYSPRNQLPSPRPCFPFLAGTSLLRGSRFPPRYPVGIHPALGLRASGVSGRQCPKVACRARRYCCPQTGVGRVPISLTVAVLPRLSTRIVPLVDGAARLDKASLRSIGEWCEAVAEKVLPDTGGRPEADVVVVRGTLDVVA